MSTKVYIGVVLLEETGLLACKPSSIPMEPSVKLCQDSDEPVLENPESYNLGDWLAS